MRNLLLIILSMVAIGAMAPAAAQPVDDDSAGDDDSAAANLVKDIQDSAAEIQPAVDRIKEAEGGAAKFAAVSLLISIILKMLLSMFKLIPVSLFRNKHFLKIFPCVIGVLIFLFTYFAGGMSLEEAVTLAISGPGAILVHELWKLAPVLQDEKQEQKK